MPCMKKDTGYELTVFGQFYHFFGIVFGNHYYLESVTRTRRDYKRILQLKQVLDFIEHNYALPPYSSAAFLFRIHVSEVFLQIFL